MRATSVVKRLTSNTNLDPTQLIAAGRSEFVPLLTNNTSDGRSKNRRIEMILSPNLDDLFKLLDE
jgi:chemotaxis protein MotB